MASIQALLITEDVSFSEFVNSTLTDSRRVRVALDSVGSIGEGISKLTTTGYDLLILDSTTYEDGGLQSLRDIYEVCAALSVIAMVAGDQPHPHDEQIRSWLRARLVKDQCRAEDLERTLLYEVEQLRMQREMNRYRAQLDSLAHEQGGGVSETNRHLRAEIIERERTEQELRDANMRLSETLTELKATEQKLIQNERLNALGQMASGMMHDFNNALVPILGYSDLLVENERLMEDKDEMIKILAAIREASQKAATKISRLRDFYRRSSDGDFYELQLNDIVRAAVEATQPKWREEMAARGAPIQINLDLEDLPTVLGSKKDLEEALVNILLNAVEAMPEGGVLTIRSRNGTGGAELEIADTGNGMTETTRQRCFEPFFSTKGMHRTGIGMSMAFGIVKTHGGSIEVHSRDGTGTIVLIRFPVVKEGMRPAGAGQDAPPPPGALRILAIDDDLQTCEFLRHCLGSDGHTVTAVHSGKAGLDVFASDQFDLVITDRAMPDMSGDDVALHIRDSDSDIPIVMVTGFGDLLQDADAIPKGVNEVVGKPFTIEELRGALARIMADVVR